MQVDSLKLARLFKVYKKRKVLNLLALLSFVICTEIHIWEGSRLTSLTIEAWGPKGFWVKA